MKMVKNKLFLLLIFSLIQGCKKDQDQNQSWDGNYAVKVQSRDISNGENQSAQLVVSSEARRSKKIYQLEISNGQIHWAMKLAWSSPEEMVLRGTPDGDFALKRRNENCFEGNQVGSTGHLLTLCFREHPLIHKLDVFSMDIRTDQFFLYKVSTPYKIMSEIEAQPKVYTFQELRKRAYDRSFDTLLERDSLNRAHNMAQFAVKRLTTSLSLSSFLSAMSLNITGILAVAGDLVPFLLPSRWSFADEKKYLFQAEQLAFRLTQINTASAVEISELSLLRDQKILSSLNENLQRMKIAYDEIETRTRFGQYEKGSDKFIELKMLGLQRALNEVEKTVALEKIELASACGFLNPDAVINLSDDGAEPSYIDNLVWPKSPSEQQQLKAALKSKVVEMSRANSPEVEQMQWVIAASEKVLEENRWDWLDPSVDSTYSALGMGHSNYLNISKSNIETNRKLMYQMQKSVGEKAGKLAQVIFSGLQTYALAKETVEKTDEIIKEMNKNFELGGTMNIVILTDILVSKAQTDIDLIQAEFDRRMNQSQINRLFQEGFYGKKGN